MASTSLVLTDVYQDLGAGPRFGSLEDGKLAALHIGASAPDDDTLDYHTFGVAEGVEGTFRYSGTENVYVRVHPSTPGTRTRITHTAVV